MPSMTTYSPYETLAFFQSVVRHGSNASAFQDISTALKQNEYIRDGANFDVDRFSTDALQTLYTRYVSDGNGARTPQVNGDTEGQRSPKRRKLSNSPPPRDGSLLEDAQLQNLVETLYLKFKDECIREIRQDEEAYQKLQGDIQALQLKVDIAENQHIINDATPSSATNFAQSKTDVDGKMNTRNSAFQPPSRPASTSGDSKAFNQAQTVPPETPSISIPASQQQEVIPTPPSQQQARSSQIPVPPNQGLPAKSFPGHITSQSPQRSAYGPIQSQLVYSPNQVSQGSTLPQVPTGQQRPHARTHQGGSQNRGSPVPYQAQHPYPPYPQYPAHQWQPPIPSQQYQQQAPYSPPPPYYSPTPGGRHPQTPQQVSYVPYPHAVPVHYMPQQQPWRQQQWAVHPASSVTTPIPRPDSRLSLLESGSSTPWKRRQQQAQIQPKSPPRPDREISPLTDREDSPVPKNPPHHGQNDAPRNSESKGNSKPQPRRRGRPPSTAPSAMVQSRSQSIASRTSDALNENDKLGSTRRTQIVKAEPPSTPLPVPSSDTEQRSSGRRGRPRGSTVTSFADGTLATTKRKRDSVSPTSPIRSPQAALATSSSRRANQRYDPSLIVASKNFAKTSQLLLNEITSHKLAGIFAKPLSERDAPGYKDLILRPQDLKNIKAAISKGGRAALAAIEAIEGEDDTTPTKAQPTSTSIAGSGPIGSGFYLVPKYSELLPPKGIINSAQLEMELVRMFANAVMFNPLPASERGFGRSLRLRKSGGDVDINIEPEVSGSEGSDSGSSSGSEEGGIISDAREMFNDIVETVGKWRELEGERMGAATDISASRHGSLAIPAATFAESGRQPSVSVSSNIGEDEAAIPESETANTPNAVMPSGPGRKRRKIAD